MARELLLETSLSRAPKEWIITPAALPAGCRLTPNKAGLRAQVAKGQCVRLYGAGVHMRNGDDVELCFRLLEGAGQVHLGFVGGFEYAHVRLDFDEQQISVETSEWSLPQPRTAEPLKLDPRCEHTLRLRKTARGLGLVKHADLAVSFDGRHVLTLNDVDILPEMGVEITVREADVQLRRLRHFGPPHEVPEHFHIGCWQMPNVADIGRNLRSLERGIRDAAAKGVRLLLTPETSMTGLFPLHPMSYDRKAISGGERRLMQMLRNTRGAPYAVVGLPVWHRTPGGRLARYNVSRVYAPDGSIHASCAKVHSCEANFHHGYRYNTFKVEGVPFALIVCHDGRYPDAQQVPVMFGARVILHPSGSGRWAAGDRPLVAVGSSEATTSSLHAFYVHTNASGGSRIVGPGGKVLAVSSEIKPRKGRKRSVMPKEELTHAVIRVHDAFGYWPLRAMRASEEVAKAFLRLYKAMGGTAL